MPKSTLSSEPIFCHSRLTSHILSRKMASDMYWTSPETGGSRRSVVLTYELREMMTLLKRGQHLAGFIPEKPLPQKQTNKQAKPRSDLFLGTKCNFPTKLCSLTLIPDSVQLQPNHLSFSCCRQRSLGGACSWRQKQDGGKARTNVETSLVSVEVTAGLLRASTQLS